MSAGARPEAAEITRAETEGAAEMDDRDRTAHDRDQTAAALDAAAETRDLRSEDRDERAEAREQRDGRVDLDAASDRASARRDRRGAAADRRQAGDDRDAAHADRHLAAVHRSNLLHDALTGAYRRDAGLMELDREIVKAERTGDDFVLAFIDVDDLKVVNDSQGHKAGDQLLSQVADAVRGAVRDYDVVVRYGGDEFICGLLGMNLAEASERFDTMSADLGSRSASATIGLALREPGEDLDRLIDRADGLMYARKSTRG